ncbi:leucine-rich repeat protein [Lentibacillus saliphilus]|uniref:leucine-rich repeat protein n=1 Tax=Lentibacillus saliphilus TaxID=2737028 RepID=UPI001C311491|nr:leucine-rich repeat protein [Lentibacillus saliphilus]
MKNSNWGWNYRKHMHRSILMLLCIVLVFSSGQMGVHVAAVETEQNSNEEVVDEEEVTHTKEEEEASVETEADETHQTIETVKEQGKTSDVEAVNEQEKTISNEDAHLEESEETTLTEELEESQTHPSEEMPQNVEKEAPKVDSSEGTEKRELQAVQQSTTESSRNVDAISEYTFYDNGDGTAIITGYTGSDTDLVIPAEIGDENLTVTTIGNSAFRNGGLTSVALPESLEVIGSWAFNNNHLTEINFPESVTEISSFSFGSNALTEVVIPTGVTIIAGSTFTGNSIQSVHIPEGVESIQNEAFRDNELVEVVLPDSLTEIKTRAFFGNQLENLEIPAQVESISTGAFRNNNLTRVTLYNSNPVFEDTNIFAGNVADAADLTLVGYPNSTTEAHANINGYSFEALPEFIFADNGDGTATITGYTGTDTDLVIPAEIGDDHLTVTAIGEEAFRSKGLTSVTLPDGVERIETLAFSYNALTELTIPGNVVSMGWRVFYANDIATLTLSEGIETIGSGAFGYNQLEQIELPKSLKTISSFAFSHNKLTTLTLPVGVHSVMRGAFRGNNLTEVTILNADILLDDDREDVFKENVDHAEDLTLIGYLSSTTETYAKEYGYGFTPIPVDITEIVSPENISVEFGTPFQEIGLPETVEVLTANDKTFQMDVTWDQGTPNYDANKAGMYMFEGELVARDGLENPQNLTVSIEVVVEEGEVIAPFVTEIADIDDMTVAYGTDISELDLPTTIEVTFSDESTLEVPVTWKASETTPYDGNKAGEYMFIGKLSEDVWNPNNLFATIQVNVTEQEKDAPKEEDPDEEQEEKDTIKKEKETDDSSDVTALPDKENEQKGDKLPSTATSMYSWLSVGGLLLILGVAVMWRSKRKRMEQA